jgi:site-specific recombinase XerD
MNSLKSRELSQIKGWTPATIHHGKSCYISFYAFCPDSGTMKRKKIMLDRQKKKKGFRTYSNDLLKKINEELSNGWNPWIDKTQVQGYTLFNDVCDKYHEYIIKMLETHDMREQSVMSYLSRLNMLRQWADKETHITYIYQLDRQHISKYLDYIYIDRNNTLQTRNNYLAWLKTFCHYIIDRGYINEDPTAGLHAIKRRSCNKQRTTIPDNVILNISEYLKKENPHYLLACYLLHYCFIRPHEMVQLQIKDISLYNHTIYIHGDIAKNHEDAVITLPDHVIKLMIDLNIFKSPGQWYLFSDYFAPGKLMRADKRFRDYWNSKLRKDLNLPNSYKFYSLKDTGITNMLRANKDVLSVRDQARHSSIAITDIYTPKDIKKANKLLLNYEGLL